MQDYVPLTGRAVVAQFAGPLTIWWGDTAPSLDFIFSYDSGGYVDLAPSGQITVTVPLANAHIIGEPVVRGLPIPPAMTTMTGLAGIGATTIPVDDTSGFATANSIKIGVGGINEETRTVSVIVGGAAATITVYISKFRGTKNILTGTAAVIHADRGEARYSFPATPLAPGLYEGQCKLNFGAGQLQRSQRFIFEVIMGTP